MQIDERLLKLVVIDDEPDMARLISDVADITGFEVAVYFDAAEFFAKYDASIDILFLDLIMPDINGMDVIRFLAEKKSPVQLILMTGFDTDVLNTARQAALSAGLNFVSGFRKPFRFEELQTLLGKLKTIL